MRFQGHQPQSGERFVGKSFAALRLDSLLYPLSTPFRAWLQSDGPPGFGNQVMHCSLPLCRDYLTRAVVESSIGFRRNVTCARRDRT